MELTWYGHSTYEVAYENTRLLIDPFFDNEQTSCDPDDVPAPDYVLVTHVHWDHTEDVDAFPDATLVAQPAVVDYLRDTTAVEDAVLDFGINIGGTIRCGDLYVTMAPAAHTNGVSTSYEMTLGPPASFYVSTERQTHTKPADEGTSFYHAGDSGLCATFRDVVGEYYSPSVAAVPMGGKVTMGPYEAAIAVEWLGCDYAVPTHYETWEILEQDLERFRAEVEALDPRGTIYSPEPDVPFCVDDLA